MALIPTQRLPLRARQSLAPVPPELEVEHPLLRQIDSLPAGPGIPGGTSSVFVVGTAGEAIPANRLVGYKADGLLYLADKNVPVYAIGFTAGDPIALGATGKIFQAGILTGQSGLTAGTTAYLGLTGLASSTQSQQVVGISLSATDVLFTPELPTKWGSIIGTITDQTDLNDAFARVMVATLETGIGDDSDTVELVALNDTTLRILAVRLAFFSPLIALGLPVTNAMKSFAQQDFALAGLGLVADGIFVRFIGLDAAGTVNVGLTSFINNPGVAELGYVLVKRVGGVVTFLDGAAGSRNVFTAPILAGVGSLERTYLTIQSDVNVVPSGIGLTMHRRAGYVRGPSIHWHQAGDPHTIAVADQTPAVFKRINPSTALAAALPADTSTVTVNTYWNGAAMVAVPAPNNATVQRWMMTNRGNLILQAGEVVYTNLGDAIDNISNAFFTDLIPVGTYIEVARTAAQANAANLANNADSVTVQAGQSASAGTGVAPGVNSVTGTAGEILAAPSTGAVVVSLVNAAAVTGTFGNATNIPQITVDAKGRVTNVATIPVTFPTAGTVTSVGLSAPSIFSVTGTPVTTSGVLALSLVTQAPNTIFAGPSAGGAAVPTFRALTPADIPALGYQPGGSVGSIAGTANEVTVSPTTGAAVVSLPNALTFTGKTVTGGTFNAQNLQSTGILKLDRTGLATSANLELAADAGQYKQILFMTGANIRWGFSVNGETESGGNAGTNLVVSRYNDAGGYIQDVFGIQRSTGNTTWYEHSNIFRWNGIGVTSTTVLDIANDAVATSALQQWSPAIHLRGDTWRTSSGTRAGAHWKIEVQTLSNVDGTNDLVFSADTSDAPAYFPKLRLGHNSGRLTWLGIVEASNGLSMGGNLFASPTATTHDIYAGGTGGIRFLTSLGALMGTFSSTGLVINAASGSAITSTTLGTAALFNSVTTDSSGTPRTAFWGMSGSGGAFFGSLTNHPVELRVNNVAIVGVSASGVNVTGGITATGTITGSNLSGTNTGDQTNIAGNAATATAFLGTEVDWAGYRTRSVANMLGWKNFGNGHVIFDASKSTSPTGTAVSNTNPDVAWTPAYPTLMGWNGANTFGVRVDLSNRVDNQQNSATLPASVAATANNIVLRDSSGHLYGVYGFFAYLNMSHAVSGATTDTIFYSSGDDYIRKNTAAGMRGSLGLGTNQAPTFSGFLADNPTNGSIVGIIRTPGGRLDLLPFFDATYGALVQAVDFSGTTAQPLTLVGSVHRTRVGGTNVTTSTAGGFSVFCASPILVTTDAQDGFSVDSAGLVAMSRTNAGLLTGRRRGSDGNLFVFFRDFTGIGSISCLSGVTYYNTSSDGRLKQNIIDYTAAEAGVIIDALQPRRFDWKNGMGNGLIGFIAQEVAAVHPDLIASGAVKPGDNDPNTVTERWERCDISLIPIIIAELKSLRARLAAAGL